MVLSLLKRVFGSRNQRVLRGMWKTVGKINALEAGMQALADAALAAKTVEFRERLHKGETLDDLLPEAFAVVREVAKRTLGMRHFDVQLLGGMVLHGGNIAEMGTGEGKTLAATLPVYLNALAGNGVHVVTVNDYLAKRDAAWMGGIYSFLGLSVGVVVPGQPPDERRAAYQADITHATNNELGFDYLRDNMAFSPEERVQRGHAYAIVDEVDSILIDEARTPLIISGAAEDSTDLYHRINQLIPALSRQAGKDSPGDYLVDEKAKQVILSEEGHQHVETLFAEAGLISEEQSLYDPANILLMHHLNAALRAHAIFQKDIDYIVQQGEVVIVDEHTGRTMPGRRWSDGLHQAIEARENVKVHPENHTLASITFQNFFRLYAKLAGMTGTADTEAFEFQQIYGLEVTVLPTNRPMIREDLHDFVYMTADEKFAAIVTDIQKSREKGQPVLVGTTSIETSEYLSGLLNKKDIPHRVLNAKFHEQEAHIIAEAGRPATVTIATNMAGRGTDIVLGGSLEAELREAGEAGEISAEDATKRREEWQKRHDAVIAAGGLFVLGTERHESRRIDNQLRGRSGRQGDPGKSRFYLSLQDNLLRIFGGERLIAIMKRLRMEEGTALESGMLSRNIENAQRKVEAYNFEIRKELLEYDDVANEQRKVIYGQRDILLGASDVSEALTAMRHEVVLALVARHIPPQSLLEQWDVTGLEKILLKDFGVDLPIAAWLADEDDLHEENLAKRILASVDEAWQHKIGGLQPEVIRPFEKAIMLQTIDMLWREHLAAMDYLRQGIGLRGYAQKNPKQEYKRESFSLFVDLLARINYQNVSTLMRFQMQTEATEKAPPPPPPPVFKMKFQHQAAENPVAGTGGKAEEGEGEQAFSAKPMLRDTRKVGRNESCPCGSGKKFKYCHGVLS